LAGASFAVDAAEPPGAHASKELDPGHGANRARLLLKAPFMLTIDTGLEEDAVFARSMASPY
jgi:hypothetical protein